MALIALNGFADSDSGADAFVRDHLVATGAVHWVDSVSGNDSNSGSEAEPLATIEQAITNATANNGDIIIIKSGHTQSVSTSITISKAGLRIFGIGNGTSAPAFTATAAIDLFNITAADVELNNLYFPAGTTATNTARINVAAARVLIVNCRFNCGAFDSNTITVTTGGDSFEARSCTFTVTADGPDAAIDFEEAVSGARIYACAFDGGSPNWDNGAVYSSEALVNYRFEEITVTNYAEVKITSNSAKGHMGNLIVGDGSAVQA